MRQWFEVLFGPELATPLAWIAAALILALLLYIFLRIVRRFNAGTFVSGGRNRMPRLAVMDAAAIDAHRRLVLVRRDDVEHLILIGGGADIVVERDIRAAGARSLAELTEADETDQPTRPVPVPVPLAAAPQPASEEIAPQHAMAPPPGPEPVQYEPAPEHYEPEHERFEPAPEPEYYEPEPEPERPAPSPVPPVEQPREIRMAEPPAPVEEDEIAPARPEPAERPAPQWTTMSRFQVPSRGPAAGTALAAAAAGAGAVRAPSEESTREDTVPQGSYEQEGVPSPQREAEPDLDPAPQWLRPLSTEPAEQAEAAPVPGQAEDMGYTDEVEPPTDRETADDFDIAELEHVDLKPADLEPADIESTAPDRSAPAAELEPAEDVEPAEDMEPMVEPDSRTATVAAFAAPSLDDAPRGERIEPEFFPPSQDAPEPEPASDLDAALLRELEASLDQPDRTRADDPAGETSLEDEMAKLLGSLSRERR